MQDNYFCCTTIHNIIGAKNVTIRIKSAITTHTAIIRIKNAPVIRPLRFALGAVLFVFAPLLFVRRTLLLVIGTLRLVVGALLLSNADLSCTTYPKQESLSRRKLH